MMEVYSNSFRWETKQGAKLIAKLVMGDMKCKKQVIMNFNRAYMNMIFCSSNVSGFALLKGIDMEKRFKGYQLVNISCNLKLSTQL